MYKQEQYKNLLKTGLSFIVWMVQALIWSGVWMHSFADIILRPFGYKGNWLVFAVYAILNLIFTSFYGGYRIGYYRRGDIILSGILALIISNIITYLQTCLIGRSIMDVSPFMIMTVVQAIVVLLWANIATYIYIKLFPPHKMLLIYGGNHLAQSLIYKFITRSEKYTIRESINITEDYDAIINKLSQYQTAVLCDLPAKKRNTILKYCFQNSIRTYTTPKISDILIRGAININLFDTPLLLNRNSGLTLEQRIIKRTVDLLISGLMLILTAPLMLLTAIMVKVYDSGPVLFKQKRCTANNDVFTLIKFRSMIVNAEKDGTSQPAVDHDPRITPVGKFIRATRLDELPQLWNIFRGDMSLVGPRPERIEHVEKYTKEIPEFVFRSKVKAGLTGYAQVVGRYNTSAYDKLKMDLMYIANYSIIEDFKLLLMTVKIMFVKSSTEGFQPTFDSTNYKSETITEEKQDRT